MAVVLRSGASPMSTRTGTQTSVPLRSSEIKIARTGLIEYIKTDGKAVNVLSLGYQGDHNVTTLRVKLWKEGTGSFANRYIPAIVFYNEKTKISNTLSMERNDAYYYVDLPQDITQDSGNYQMYFLLKESLSGDITESGDVGVADDPSYREVFVSDSWKGVVDDKSGFSLMPQDFTWAKIHNYNEGRITPYEWYKDEDTSIYTASIYLAGLQDGKGVEDIDFDIPKEFEIYETPSLGTEAGRDGTKTLEISLEPITEMSSDEIQDALDRVIIIYPVEFDPPSFTESDELHKVPVAIEFTPNTVAAKNNQNLGMKYDSYITPIDVSGLRALPGETKKYVIFAKDGKSFVCESYGSYCWIPAEVTALSGTWQVSFVVKDDDYTYYTGILKLPVVDNKLKQNDLKVDTAYRAVLDNEGTTLYDRNGYSMLVRSQNSKEVNLEHSAGTINRAIGWVEAVRDENISAEKVVNTINSLSEIQGTHSTLTKDVSDLKTKTNKLETDVTSIENSIDEIREEITNLDVVELQGKVEENTESIEALDSRITTNAGKISTLETKTSALERKDTQLQTSISNNATQIALNKNDIQTLENIADEMRFDLDAVTGRTNVIRAELDSNIEKTKNLTGRVVGLEDAFDNQVKDLIEEVSQRGAADEALSTRINQEAEARTNADNNLQTQINAESLRAETKEGELQTELDNTQKDLEDLATRHDKELSKEIEDRQSADSALGARTTTLENTQSIHNTEIGRLTAEVNGIKEDKSIIRNNYLGEEKPFVARIVFLSSEEEYEALEKKEAGTLYLIQEEE